MSVYIEEFEKMYGVSGNIYTLRDKVLELAFQGELIDVTIDDDIESYYLKLLEDRNELINNGTLKKMPTFSSKLKAPYEVPFGWKWVYLGEIVDIGSARRVKKAQWKSEGVPFYRAREIVKMSKYGKVNNELYVSEEHYSELNDLTGVPSENDLMVTGVGTIGTTYVVQKSDRFYFKDASVLWFRNYANFNPAYIKFFMHSPSGKSMIHEDAMGTTVSTFTISRANDILIPLLPIEAQNQIVYKIESLMAQIDQLEEKLKKKEHLLKQLPQALVDSIGACETGEELKVQLEFTIRNFEIIFQTPESMKELRNVILQLAIEGKLVQQDPTDEPASELVKRIKFERDKLVEDKKIKKPKELELIGEDVVPFEIPESWEWVRLNEITDINPRNQLEDDIDVSFIPMKLMEDGYGSKYSCEVKKWKELKKGYTHFAENDIAVAKITPCFENRKSAILNDLESGFGAGTTEFHIVRVYSDGVDRKYLLNMFKTQWFIKNGVDTFSGTAGQQRISTDFMKEYIMPLPPYNEQLRILNQMNSLFFIIDQMEEKLKRKVEIIEKLATA